MAKVFYGQDTLTGQKFLYVYGRVNQHQELTRVLDELLISHKWSDSKTEPALKWLVDVEVELLAEKSLAGYEFLVCPFTDGKTLKNLPFLRMVFDDGSEYVRSYDGFSPIKVSEHAKDHFMNPVTRQNTVEIVRVEESV